MQLCVSLSLPRGQKKKADPLGLTLQMVVSYLVGAGNPLEEQPILLAAEPSHQTFILCPYQTHFSFLSFPFVIGRLKLYKAGVLHWQASSPWASRRFLGGSAALHLPGGRLGLGLSSSSLCKHRHELAGPV